VIDRRTFLAGTGAVLLAAPLAADAQQPEKVWRVGYLGNTPLTDPVVAGYFEALRHGLQEHGYVEGRNLVIERRFSEGVDARLPALASELIHLKVDILVTSGGPAAVAAKEATATIPIVMAGASDPVRRGLVTSLAHPGGNITGIEDYLTELNVKRLELLKTAVPKMVRVGVLTNVGAWEPATMAADRKHQDAQAQAIGVTIFRVELNAPSEFDSATAAIIRGRPDALTLVSSPINFRLRNEIAEFATKHRLPSAGSFRGYALAGILLSYGPDLAVMFRRAADYVDKILKGAKPGDLPVEQPAKFELVINLKTAKALGLTIPPSLLGRADEVIE
jgi:putative tryptophan/tyrosine transport system substrate-binding protein